MLSRPIQPNNKLPLVGIFSRNSFKNTFNLIPLYSLHRIQLLMSCFMCVNAFIIDECDNSVAIVLKHVAFKSVSFLMYAQWITIT